MDAKHSGWRHNHEHAHSRPLASPAAIGPSTAQQDYAAGAGALARRHAKWAATIAMVVSATASLVVLRAHWAALVAVACMACVLAWLWRRPEESSE